MTAAIQACSVKVADGGVCPDAIALQAPAQDEVTAQQPPVEAETKPEAPTEPEKPISAKVVPAQVPELVSQSVAERSVAGESFRILDNLHVPTSAKELNDLVGKAMDLLNQAGGAKEGDKGSIEAEKQEWLRGMEYVKRETSFPNQKSVGILVLEQKSSRELTPAAMEHLKETLDKRAQELAPATVEKELQ